MSNIHRTECYSLSFNEYITTSKRNMTDEDIYIEKYR